MEHMNGDDLIEWVEPWDEHCDVTLICRMTKRDAIAARKRMAAWVNYTYKSDEEALRDFMVVRWATEVPTKVDK